MTETARRFYIRAMTPECTLFAGEIEARDEAAAGDLLRQRGYTLLELSANPLKSGLLQREIRLPGADRLSLKDSEQLCRELGQLHTAGVPTSRALSLLAEAAPKGSRLRLLADRAGHGLRLGFSLSRALATAGYRFPPDLLPSLEAAERSGEVGKVLLRLAEAYAEQRKFRSAYVSALAYPAFLVLVALGVLAMIALVVAPNLISVFETLGRPAPALIAVLGAIGQGVVTAPMPVILGTALAALALLAVAMTPVVQLALRQLAFRLPGVGTALRWAATERLSATLAMQLRARTDLPTAVATAFETSNFPHSEKLTQRAIASLQSGDSLARTFARIAIIPARAATMLRIGEETGRLPEMLEAVANESRQNFQTRMAALSGLLAPLLILIVGGMIGTIVFSVFSALAEMNNFSP
jgi:type II secretory pathway component PulF